MPYPLLTERLTIEPMTMRDLASFVTYRQDPEIARYQSWEPTFSTQQGEKLITAQEGVLLPSPGEWLQLAIHDRTTGELLGDLAVHAIAVTERSFEIGFTLAQPHQGKGIAREATQRLLEFLFTEADAQAVRASCDRRNAPSVALLDALGFRARPTEGWVESFKGEKVSVDVFEITSKDGIVENVVTRL